jgi:4-alpha-glucanotransferase
MKHRRGGILLHPTSLPSRHGSGDLGPEAHAFVDFLADSGCGLWQMLPLGPTGYGESPYQCLSAFAGDPLLVAPEPLVEAGLLQAADLELPPLPAGRLDFARCRQRREAWLRKAFTALPRRDHPLWSEFEAFYQLEGWWLHDVALFLTIKNLSQGQPWNKWPADLRRHDDAALTRINTAHQEEILFHKFCQFLFYRQVESLQAAAGQRGIRLVGDVPIFVAYDSADVWAWRHYFRVDEAGCAEVLAGVPPDYFSRTGQLWGNPHYRWDSMQADDFWWWRSRFSMLLRQAGTVRVDHFRGFAASWEVPGKAETAEHGVWAPAPGRELFQSLRKHLPGLSLIAEDLGVITPDVEALRHEFGLPGMKVFQFGFFSDAGDPFLPHNYEKNCVAYTGTHDNNTFLGFLLEDADAQTSRRISDYLGTRHPEELPDAAVEAIWRSSADWAVAPMQDLLGLGADARMNTPGTTSGNWAWRLPRRWPSRKIGERLAGLNRRYGRGPETR